MTDESKLKNLLNEEDTHKTLQTQPQSECEEQQMPREAEDETAKRLIDNVENIGKRAREDKELGSFGDAYRTIFENYAVAITLVDEQERIISWNKYTEELLGMNENDLYMVPVSTLYPPEEWQRMRKENIRRKGIKYRMETKMTRKNKEFIDVEISICVLKSEKGKTVGSVGIIKDITKQKEMEKALEKSEKKFKQLYEKAPVPYHTLSPSGVITDVNEIWCQLLGYNKDEVIGKPIFDFVHETEREAAKVSFEKKLQSKIVFSQSNERAYITKTGEKRIFMIRDFFSFDSNNNVDAVYTIMDDRTDLKKAEYELQKNEIIRESARRLQTVIDTVNDGITLSDTQGCFEIFNAKMEEITGYSKHEADVCNDFMILIYPDQNEQKKALENISETLKKGVSKNFETTIQTKTGAKKTLWVSSSITSIDGHDLFLSVYHDITERKKAEESLRESEARFRQLGNSLPQLVWTCQADGPCDFLSQKWVEYTGIPEAQQLGFGWLDQLHPDDRAPTVAAWKEAIASGGDFRVEFRIRRHDGEYRWFDTLAVRLRDEQGRTVKWFGSNTDITERRRAAEALAESEKKHRALFETMSEGIVYEDHDGKIISANPAAERLLGLSLDQMQGRTSLDPHWKAIHEDGSPFPGETHSLNVAAKTGKPATGEVMGIYNPQLGTYVWLSVNSTPEFRLGEKKPFRAYAVFRDITERKKAEQLLKESEEQFRTIFDSATDGILIADMENKKFLTGNNTICNMLDYGMEEIKNLGVMEIHPKEDLPFVIEQFEKQARKEIVSAENIPMKRKDGSVFYVDINSAHISLSGKTYLMGSFRDITERKKAEEEINYLKEYNENILESNPNSMMVVKGQRIEYVNKSFVSIFGKTKNEYTERNLKDMLPSEIFPAFENLLQEDGISKELKFRGKDYAVSSFVIKKAEEEEEEEVRKGIVFLDITERKQAEKSLLESEERHRILFESSVDAIMTIEPPSWKFTSGNPATVKMFKAKNIEEFFSLGPWDVSPEHQSDGRASAEMAKEMIEKAMREGSSFFEWTHKRLDGHDFPATVLLTRMEIKGKQFLQATVRDITEQKQTETEREKILLWQQGVNTLQQSLLTPASLDDKLKMITDNVVRLFDVDFCRVWLTQPGDLCGQGCTHAEIHEGPHVCRYRDRCLRLRASSGRYTHTDGKIHRRVPFGCYKIGRVASGEEHKFLTNDVQNDSRVHNNDWARELGLVSFAGYQLRVPGGETIGVLALFAKHQITPAEDTMLDGLSSTIARITQQAIAEDSLIESTRKIETQNVQLKKLDKIKSDFLNITSHELRTPMSAIKGYTQMVFKQKLGQVTDEQRQALNVVLRNTDRLDNLIRDILDISRLESGTMKFVPEKTNPGKMVKEAIETMQPTAELKNIKINTEIENDVPEMMVDPERIKQVIINIVSNSIKFSPNGTIINVRTKKEKDMVLFEIQDFGRGIPKDKQEKVFEIFYQVDSGMDRKFGGAGLGLAISRGIILSHGGNIWVESEPDKGSTFRFALPITPVQDLEGKFRDVDIFKLKDTKRAIENDLRDKTVVWDEPGEKRGEKT